MSTPNRDRVSKGLDLVRKALIAYMPPLLKKQFGDNWWKTGVHYAFLPTAPNRPKPVGDEESFRADLDLAAMLTVMERNWGQVFGAALKPQDKNYFYLTRDARNGWAHHTGDDDVPLNDANFWLGAMERFLDAIGAPESRQVEAIAKELIAPLPVATPRPSAGDETKPAKPVQPALISSQTKPWREVIQPHSDVREGRLLEAEFVVNLADVLAGKAEFGYQDAASFFDRTYLTAGLTELLAVAIRRLSGDGGVPVVQLKTAFGGGKTHTMLALYHLARAGANAARLPGLAPVFASAGVDPERFGGAQVAVLVGTALDANKSHLDAAGNGIEVRTLWGELAAQIGGARGYALVEDADRHGRSPGSDSLVELLELAGPTLILIDELVAYARNLMGRDDLPAGTFDAVMTFIQALTEAAKRSKQTLLVASIPDSEVEYGNEAGKHAQIRLEHTFGRLESIWKPVTPAEGFEIVRRRLFGDVSDPAARDAVCQEFARLYNDASSGDFPQEAASPAYLDELKRSYPVHPEVFQQLYETWSTLERFQRTRGVLRLMALIIHELWARGDQSRIIMPGALPLDAGKVRGEFLRYLSPTWEAVIDNDVDGPNSEPVLIDQSNVRLGQHQAARRVARTIFLASAPTVAEQGVRGVESARIRLGSLEPNVPLHVANEAIQQLGERATYLYGGSGRYWYDTRPNLNRTADARAAQIPDYELTAEIRKRLVAGSGGRGTADNPFGGVHIFPVASDVPDDGQVRLVVLPADAPHASGGESAAKSAAMALLDSRGATSRLGKNMAVFLAADRDGAQSLQAGVRQYLAWREIEERKDELNLDTHGRRQAQENLGRWNATVDGRVQEAYAWLLAPRQEGSGPWELDIQRVTGQTPYIRRVVTALRQGQLLIETLSPKVLRMAIDRWYWKGDETHLDLKRLWETFTNYGYMERLRDGDVLRAAVAEGVRSPDFFGYAAGVSKEGRFEGLVFNQQYSPDRVMLDGLAVLVRPEAAIAQIDRDERGRTGPTGGTGETGQTGGGGGGRTGQTAATGPSGGTAGRPPARRFHATVDVNPVRPLPALTQIVEEVVQHLAAASGVSVRLVLEIDAKAPAGMSEDLKRTVSENAKTLNFRSAEFETE